MVESYDEQPGICKTYLFEYKVKSYLGSQVDFVTFVHDTCKVLLFPPVSCAETVSALVQVVSQNKESDEDTTRYGDVSDDHKSKPDKDAELLSWLYRVSVKIRADLKNTPGYNAVEPVNRDQVVDIVSESLYILLKLIYMGDDFEDKTEQEQLKPKLF